MKQCGKPALHYYIVEQQKMVSHPRSKTTTTTTTWTHVYPSIGTSRSIATLTVLASVWLVIISPQEVSLSQQRRQQQQKPRSTATTSLEDSRHTYSSCNSFGSTSKRVAIATRSFETNTTNDNGTLFHVVFTVNTFTTLNLRCLESILFYHPTARLKIHSNAVFGIHRSSNMENASAAEHRDDPQHHQQQPESSSMTSAAAAATATDAATHVRAWQNMGFRVEIVPYDAATVLRRAVQYNHHYHRTKHSNGAVGINATAARLWESKLLSHWKTEQYWYSNEANLLRLCLLYTQGGIYLDTDVVLVRPLVGLPTEKDATTFSSSSSSSTSTNANTSLRSASRQRITEDTTDGFSLITTIDNAMARDGGSFHNAVLKFMDAGNLFLAAAINDFIQYYNGNVWGNNGPRVFRRISAKYPQMICPDLSKNSTTSGHTNTNREKTPSDQWWSKTNASNARMASQNDKEEDQQDDQRFCWMQPLPAEAFQPVPWRQWNDYCFDPRKSPVGDKAWNIVNAPGVYAVHFNNHLIGNALEAKKYVPRSICDIVLNDLFCLSNNCDTE